MRLYQERETFSMGIFRECQITGIKYEQDTMEALHIHGFKEWIPYGSAIVTLNLIDKASGSEIEMKIPLSSIEGAPQSQAKLEHQQTRIE